MTDRDDDSNWTWLAWAGLAWWLGAAIIGGAGLFVPSLAVPWPVIIYCGCTVIASFVAFLAYGLDKWLAGSRYGRRVPERILHWLELVGGWSGALLAQQLFHHKTRKFAFGLLFWSIVAMHLVVIVYCGYLWAAGGSTTPHSPVPVAKPDETTGG